MCFLACLEISKEGDSSALKNSKNKEYIMYDVCESTADFNKFNFIKKFYTVSLSDTQSLCSCLTEYVVLWPKILFLLACVGHLGKKYSVKKDLSEVV